MVFALDDFYRQTKTPISFRCRWGLNPKSLIQPLKTLSVELTGTYKEMFFLVLFRNIFLGFHQVNVCNIEYKLFVLFFHVQLFVHLVVAI